MNKVWWPYQVTIEVNERFRSDDSGWIARKNWLREHLDTMNGIYYINGETYCFTDERDMLHFLLVNQ
jgi:hypothetical protein